MRAGQIGVRSTQRLGFVEETGQANQVELPATIN